MKQYEAVSNQPALVMSTCVCIKKRNVLKAVSLFNLLECGEVGEVTLDREVKPDSQQAGSLFRDG